MTRAATTLLCLLLLSMALCGATARAQPAPPAPLACSVDSPVAPPGAAVTLRAWTEARDVTWQVSGGTLETEGAGGERTWRLPQRPGRLTASASAGASRCALVVFAASEVRAPPPPPPTATPAPSARETGTLFLPRGEAEPVGYGLYSYFLLGAPPASEHARERVLKAIDAFLAMTPSLTALEALLERSELNANQMPVDAPPPGDAPGAPWVLAHYDYARARALLARIEQGTLRQGPYLVSMLQPAGPRGALPAPLLLQDLSAVPPHLVGDWYRLFLNQAAQEHFWESRQLEAVGVRMRTMVGVLALGLPDVQGAVKQWVTWGK